MRPSVLSQHKEHRDIKQPQKINIDSMDAIVSSVALKNDYRVEGDGNLLTGLRCAQTPCRAMTRSSHFATFTPLMRSHRQNDDSPISGGSRIAGVMRSARVGAKSAAKHAVR